MNIRRCFAICFSFTLLLLLLQANQVAAENRGGNSKYACSEPNPETLCNASNTCGSASAPCTVDVKRTSYAAEAVPSISKAKGNALFCVKVGTTVTWQSTSKNTGFVVDFGSSSPFEPSGTIIGGSDRPIPVVAKREGCYKYSAGACVSGGLSGMCGSANAETVVVGDSAASHH
jgi:hypothetical protein